jgi:hypothetical protein
VSRPERAPDVAVDFAPPPGRNRTRPLLALTLVVLALSAMTVAVTQLLLR